MVASKARLPSCFGGKGIDGERFDFMMHARLDNVACRARADGMAANRHPALLLGPAPVAIHDDSDVAGHFLRVEFDFRGLIGSGRHGESGLAARRFG